MKKGTFRRQSGKRGGVTAQLDLGWQWVEVAGERVRRKKYLTKTFRTKDEAEKWATAEALRIENGGALPLSKNITLGEWLDVWLADHIPSRVSAHTLHGYTRNIRKYIVPQIGAVKLRALNAEHLTKYQAWALREGGLKKKGGLSPNTVMKHRAVLYVALDDALRLGYLMQNPLVLVRAPKLVQAKQRALSVSECGQLMTAAKPTPYYAVIFVGLHAALRSSEARGLQWGDVDFERGILHVRRVYLEYGRQEEVREEGKNETALGPVTISPECVQVLADHRERERAKALRLGQDWTMARWVFTGADGRPMPATSLNNRFKEIAKEAKLTPPVLRFHHLRHTHGSLMLHNNPPAAITTVQARLRHKSLATTIKWYAHEIPGSADDAGRAFSA